MQSIANRLHLPLEAAAERTFHNAPHEIEESSVTRQGKPILEDFRRLAQADICWQILKEGIVVFAIG